MRLSFTKLSTSLVLSIVALPVSITAFIVLYGDFGSLWAAIWMLCILPGIWIAAIILGVRDLRQGRSRRQTAGVVALLLPTVLLVISMCSWRFAFHQMFTFRPLDLHLPPGGFLMIHEFRVCESETPCAASGPITETQTQEIKLKRVPDGCCTMLVFNGGQGKRKVDDYRISLNGRDIRLTQRNSVGRARVSVDMSDELSVQLSGIAGATLGVALVYTGEKTLAPAKSLPVDEKPGPKTSE